MLTDEQITDRKLPILRRLDDLNNYISGVFALGISDGRTQEEYAQDLKKVQKKIKDTAVKDVDEIYGLLFLVALSMYKDSKTFFEYNKVTYTNMSNNKPVMNIINGLAGEFVNSHLNKLKLDNMYINTSNGERIKAETWYKRALSRKNNRKDLNTLAESGIRVKNELDNTSRLDTDFENDIDNSIKELSQSVQDEIGKQFGADGKELSVHAFPAPDHAPVQGHVFYNEEYDKMQDGEDFEDVDGNKFKGFERAIGMWNCRHFAFSVVVGVHPRNYTQKQLNDILNNNEKGYTHKGKHITMYQCTQLQRRYEREIRRAKDGYIVAKSGDNKELMEKYRNRVNKYINEYKAFSKGCGLRMKYNRIYVEGYKP